jgi:hypothetical protein
MTLHPDDPRRARMPWLAIGLSLLLWTVLLACL